VLAIVVCPYGVDLLVIPEQAQLLLTNLDRAATKLRNENLVANLHARGDPLSIAVICTRANGNHLGLVELLNGGLRQEDTSRSLSLWLDALHKDAVKEGRNGADRLDGRLEVVLARGSFWSPGCLESGGA
jgi:hypothetical protein